MLVFIIIAESDIFLFLLWSLFRMLLDRKRKHVHETTQHLLGIFRRSRIRETDKSTVHRSPCAPLHLKIGRSITMAQYNLVQSRTAFWVYVAGK